ncbi:hypothetical protein BN7_225 [Wickerhamomyces ciferrii]|uniref:Phosphoglycerate mutase n=1 Tax=Wickerhamomyces ciferrii (strain ATCC 14091 / BCRC 22168 / CBS 111 / JCM 3599 / NBRC 0793 / NRRL Y-1031 F-60-10) TaxID=1206466 RepID=K0KCS3_WICCF|nr:uncharacterized protein BN7_225 [Wickerhamomyces ciferrii]CCH40691.1 hypothetical protein BN7_225 [Wickerhamomyces ciferrii]
MDKQIITLQRFFKVICEDTDLNQEGIDQAKLAAEKLKDYPFDAFYSSDLKRCRDTANTIHKSLTKQVDIQFSSNLRERNMGEIEGMKISDAVEKAAKDGKESYREYGEKPIDLVNRVKKQLDEILELNKQNKNIIICSHGGTIRTILKILGFKENLIVYNTSITTVDFNHNDFNDFKIVTVSDTKHLGGDFKVADTRVR